MNINMHVTKRDGSRVLFDLGKWQAQIAKVCEGVADVSPSMIEIAAQAHFRDGMSTRELDEIALKSMVNLIDEEEHPEIGNVNYQYVAGKQRLTMLRKDVFGTYTPPPLYEIVKRNVELELYTHELMEWYTEDDWNELQKHIDHDKDELLPYAAVDQLVEKYLIRNRATGLMVETPQVRYMIAAATMFHAEKKDRLKWVRDFYTAASDGMFTMATPVLAGLGTKTKQFSSCVLIKTDDSLKSIFASGEVMADYASKRAGIGFDIGRMRPLGASIRKGEIMHTGIVPFLKKWFGDLRSCSAGGVRNAAATINMPIWHYQFDDFIVLKNNKGTEETRVRQMDYCVVLSKFFWRRFKQQGVITFFDPNEVPELYDAFYSDTPKFEAMYVKYEKRKDLRTKTVEAEVVFKDWLLKERVETGRIYMLNIDNVQNQGPFDPTVHPIYQTNLCFSGDTLVAVADGRNVVSMQDLEQQGGTFGVYAARKAEGKSNIRGRRSGGKAVMSEWKTVIREARAIKTGERELVRVHLEDGDFFDATPDHRLATTKYGVWVHAADSAGAELEPFASFANAPKDRELPLQWTWEQNGDDLKWKGRRVLRVEHLGVQPCYDVQVLDNGLTDDEHNFYIITSGGVDYRTSKGVLVHNCTEIMLPTRSFQRVEDPNGRIALCTLGSMNWGAVRNPEELRRPVRLLHRGLHNLLQYQDFMSIHSELHNKEFEPLGIGITNVAYWHAKRKLKYGEPEALAEVKRWMEHQAFYLTEMSVDLAKEKGACEMSPKTRYGQGIFPWEMRAAGVNELTDFTPSEDLDWEALRTKMKQYGVRNATTMAIAPVESSSVVLNSTNGINLVKELIIEKGSKAGNFVQVAPEYKKLKQHYQLLWDQKDCLPYLKTVCVLQAFVDQGISADTYYSPRYFPDGKVDINLIARNQMLFIHWGGKSNYYHLVEKQATMDAMKADADIEAPAPLLPVSMSDLVRRAEMQDEADCEACVL